MRFAVAVLLIVTSLAPSAFAAQKNVLLIISDDQGLDGGCFGNPAVATPNLDKLAAEGTRFANAFATVSSCSPSRAVIQTGLYTHQNGQYGLAHAAHNQWTRPNVQSLAKLLGERGYRTANIGKNHVQPASVYNYEVTVGPGGAAPTAEAASKFLAEKDDRPFYCVVAFTEPHRAGKGFNNEAKNSAKPTRTYEPADVKVPPFLSDTPEVRADIANYYTAIDRLDQGVGTVLAALDASGRRDDTLVIFVSDNGMPFPGAKTTVYDAGIRLPLIVRAPGRKAGVLNPAMVSWIDIAPTVLEFAGAKVPPRLPGRSVLPILDQDDAADRDTVYASYVMHEITMYYPMRAIRTRTHKLIWNIAHPLPYPIAADIGRSPTWETIVQSGKMGGRSRESYLHRPEFELYDLTTDPDELKNLADDPAQAKLLGELKERLKARLRETRDPWLGEGFE
jgi:N-sulfoglucosamine sulfohydrolase